MSTNYEFKKIGDVDVIESINDSAHVIIEDSGVLKKMAAKNIGAVKTVNGAAPDADGNVQIEVEIPEMPEINYPVTSVNGMTGDVVIEVGSTGGSGGGVSSWNDLTDKPFGEEQIVVDIHWDGEIGDKPYVNMEEEYFVHVSDCVLNSADAFIGMTITYFEVDGDAKTEKTVTVESHNIMEMDGIIMIGMNAFVIPSDNFNYAGITFPKAGIYFAKFPDMYTSSLVGESTVVNKLDSKYTNNPVTLTLSYTYNEEYGEYENLTSDFGFSDIGNAFKNGQGVYISYPVEDTGDGMDCMYRVPAEVTALGESGVYFVYYLSYTDLYGQDMTLACSMEGMELRAGNPFKQPSSDLPEVTTENNGQILGVTDGAWGVMNAPSSLPEVSVTDNGKILTVTDGAWGVGEIEIPEIPKELPEVTADNEGAFLRIVDGIPTWVVMENAEDGVY